MKFRVGQIVYLAFSRDETIMGFAFPKEERDALVASEPEKFLMPTDLRPALQLGGACGSPRSTTTRCASWCSDAWRMVVPKRVAADYFGG